MKRLLLAAILFAAALTLPTQAEFILCNLACAGTSNADLMSGSDSINTLWGLEGDDLIFGMAGFDTLFGDPGDDIIFGGNDRDILEGGPGNDIVLPGPDGMSLSQISKGEDGNDSFVVLVGETANCQEIRGGLGYDVLHLIGFGPYVAEFPYGQPEPVALALLIFRDPVAGGYIFVQIGTDPANNVERINGLPSQDFTVLRGGKALTFLNKNCL